MKEYNKILEMDTVISQFAEEQADGNPDLQSAALIYKASVYF